MRVSLIITGKSFPSQLYKEFMIFIKYRNFMVNGQRKNTNGKSSGKTD